MKISHRIEHTLLKQTATYEDIKRLCEEAKRYGFHAVMVNPSRVKTAKAELFGSDVKIGTVIGFPLGENTTAVKAAEAREAAESGADELDMVINVGRLKDGDLRYVEEDIAAVRAAAKGRLLKVILECSLLTDSEIAAAVEASARGGADFVKTSSGFFGNVGADIVKMLVALSAGRMQVKAAGGIRTFSDAVSMMEAGATRLGTSAGVIIAAGAE